MSLEVNLESGVMEDTTLSPQDSMDHMEMQEASRTTTLSPQDAMDHMEMQEDSRTTTISVLRSSI